MGNAVDAAGEAGDNRPTGADEPGGDALGHAPAVGCALPGADDADGVAIRVVERAPVVEELRGVVDGA